MTRAIKVNPHDTHEYVAYNAQHMRKDLRDRLRKEAKRRKLTTSEILNLALAIGLPGLESQDVYNTAFRDMARMLKALDEYKGL